MRKRLKATVAMALSVATSLSLAGAAIAGRSLTSIPNTRASEAAGGLCEKTRIDGITENLTGHPIRLTHAGHGTTNAWCKRPSDEVLSGHRDEWTVGDNFFTTRVHLVYSVSGGNKVHFVAQIKLFHDVPSRPSTRCNFERHAKRNPRRSEDNAYSCEVETSVATGHHFVRFVVSKLP